MCLLIQQGAIVAKIEIGQRLPRVQFPMTGGTFFDVAHYEGRFIVLFFYPKDMTPGCTIETQEFSDLKSKFAKLNAICFGVSRDSIKSHEKFKDKYCYQIDLISDEKEELCKLFDVIKEKNMYGKKVRGIERSTFILDPSGKLIFEWRKVKAPGHAEEVLNWLKSYQK